MGTIYVFRNSVNGKCYVGQKINIKKRFWYHQSCANWKSYLTLIERAVKKYGWDAFEKHVFSGIPTILLDRFEIELIRRLGCRNPSGYNLEGGGNKLKSHHPESNRKRGNSIRGERHPLWGTHLSQEQKQHLSNHWKGRRLSEEVRMKISIANRGKKRTLEMRRANSQRHLGKNIGAGNWKSKKIICIDTRESFNCISDAARKYGINRSHIGECCMKKLKTCGGLRWAYSERRIA